MSVNIETDQTAILILEPKFPSKRESVPKLGC